MQGNNCGSVFGIYFGGSSGKTKSFCAFGEKLDNAEYKELRGNSDGTGDNHEELVILEIL